MNATKPVKALSLVPRTPTERVEAIMSMPSKSFAFRLAALNAMGIDKGQLIANSRKKGA